MMKPKIATGVVNQNAVLCIALLPALVAHCQQGGTVPFRAAVLAWVAAMAIDALCRFLRQQEIKPNSEATLTAWMVTLSLPMDSPVWLAAAGSALAVGIGRHAYGGGALIAFHPAMLGVAVLSVWLPEIQHVVPANGSLASMPRPALALAISGIGLCFTGVIRWQLPVTFLLALSGVLFLGGHPASFLPMVLAPIGMLVAFFIVTDSQTSPVLPRPRVLFGLLTGALSGWSILRGQPRLAEVVLFGNLLVPWLDHWALAAHSRRREQRQQT